MKYSYNQLLSVQLEISSYCNAACPQCPRNNYGGPVIKDLPLVNWSLSDLQKILKVDFIKQLKQIYFCGTYGDPLFNKNIVDMCQWLKEINPDITLGIHTNGSLATLDVFKKLAELVDFIAFGIDGLEDTNHLYRRNTNWHTIVANVTAFIQAGGVAYWDFIVFQHNQHQVDDAKKTSALLGFAEFNIKKTSRFFNKEHKLVDSLSVLDNNLNPVYLIKPSTDDRYVNSNYHTIKQIDLKEYVTSTEISCHYLRNNEIYIGSDGYVFPCGWLHDRLYGIESSRTSDFIGIRNLMTKAGGQHMANCFQTELKDIVDGDWFDVIQHSWQHARLERCALLCGDHVNLIKEQNEHVHYN